MDKQVGVLLPIFSLPSHYGIGDFGQSAYEFIDLLSIHHIALWQILPLNPVGYGHSPYQPFSSYAGEELYISLTDLIEERLLKQCDVEIPQFNQHYVEYEKIRKYKQKYLKMAYCNFKKGHHLDVQFKQFKNTHTWVYDYARFITNKKANNMKCWLEWEVVNVYEDDDLEYEMFVQFLFYYQWWNLKQYAMSKNITIMGDMPIYVGLDSCDVIENKQCFLLDDQGRPTYIAGVPPDYFSKTGQRWGNPLYNWEYLQEDHFKFWINRLKWSQQLYDIVRIDHFRAFDTYWKIPISSPTAIDGEWIEAPGYELFDEIYKQLPNIHIVAEDLGDLRAEVSVLKNHYKLSGMKVLQFELNKCNNIEDLLNQPNTIVYTGTHDNQTLKGWYESQTKDIQKKLHNQLKNYIGKDDLTKILSLALATNAELVVIPLQDIMKLDDSCKINTPGTINELNWSWKLDSFKDVKKGLLYFSILIQKYNRMTV